jgi:hypothetical protein
MPKATLDFSDYITDRTRDFVGREWVFAEIDAWLADPDAPRFFIITGEPGIGKTAIAARLTQIRDLAACHFCIARQADTIDPLNFARFLSHQLTHIDDFAQNLLEEQGTHVDVTINLRENYGQIIGVQIENLVVEAPSAAIAFNRVVLDPLRRLHAGDFDQPLLLLVDALDEAVQQRGPETIVDLLANARGLPPQVRFVLTSRPEGAALRHFEQLNIPHLVLDAGGAENQADVQTYVRYRLDHSETLRSRLTKEAVEADAFVERVIEASQGNFLYLVWLLRSVEEGTQQFDSLETLPEGLDGIYREFLRTRAPGEDIRVWRERYRPLLGVLAAAQAPLTTDQLVAFTELDKQMVKDVLDDVQQFLDPIGAGENRHRLYHQSVIDFLKDERRAGEFWIEDSIPHRIIAEHYLQAWGGLADGLPKLDTPRFRDLDNRYGLHNVIPHLVMANCLGSVHQILQLERKVGDWHENVWYAVRDSVGDLSGYLADINQAWQTVGKGSLDLPDVIELHCRYALMLTSINSLAKEILPTLLVQLVAKRAWEPEQGLAYARRIPDNKRRVEVLLGLAPYLDMEDVQVRLAIREMMSTVLIDRDPSIKRDFLMRFTPYTPHYLVPEISALIVDLQEEDIRDSVLAQWATRLVELQSFERALEVIKQIEKPDRKSKALVDVAHEFPSSFLSIALDIARSIDSRTGKALALIGVARNLEEPCKSKVLQQVVDIASKILFDGVRSHVLKELAVCLPSRKRELLQRSMESAQKVKVKVSRVERLLGIASHLPEPDRTDILTNVVSDIDATSVMDERLLRMAPKLVSVGRPEQALRLVDRAKSKKQQMELLATLIPQLPAPLRQRELEKALTIVENTEDRSARIVLMATLIPHLPNHRQPEASKAILGMLKDIDNARERKLSLEKVIPYLPTSALQQVLLMTRAVRAEERKQVSASSSSGSPRQEAEASRERYEWTALRSKYPETQNSDFIWKASTLDEYDEALNRLAARHSESILDIYDRRLRRLKTRWTTLEDLENAPLRTVASKFKKGAYVYKDVREWLNYVMGLYKPKGLKIEVEGLDSLDLLKRPGGEVDEHQSSSKIAELFAVLPEEEIWKASQQIYYGLPRFELQLWLVANSSGFKNAAVQSLLTEVKSIADHEQRLRMLIWLTSRLPEALKRDVMERARIEANNTYASYSVVALVWIAAHSLLSVKVEIYQEALEMASSIRDPVALFWVKSRLPKYLSTVSLQASTEKVTTFQAEKLLMYLTTHLGNTLADLASRKAFEGAASIEDTRKRFQALVWLLRYLPGALRRDALHKTLRDALSIADAEERTLTLTWLLSHLPNSVKGEAEKEALQSAASIKDAEKKVSVFVWLLSYLPISLQWKAQLYALRAALSIMDMDCRTHLLMWLLNHLPDRMKHEALRAIFLGIAAVNNEHHKIEILMRLEPHLTKAFSNEALAMAINTERGEARARILIQLSACFSKEEGVQAIENALVDALGIDDKLIRHELMAELVARLEDAESERLYLVFVEALRILATESRQRAIADLKVLIPMVVALGGIQAEERVYQAIETVRRWWS